MSKAIPLVSIQGIDKRFGATHALRTVSFEVHPGDILGLIGENGSGKSTVTSILAGMQKADEGTMLFHGEPWNPSSMIDAVNHGIGMIVQESGTINGISVAENIFLGELDPFRRHVTKGGKRWGLIDRKRMNEKAKEALLGIGIDFIDPSAPMFTLDFQGRKLVEIAKVMMKKPEVLVIDETSTALASDGRKILYAIIKRMHEENKAVIFISHDLDEIMEVCTTLTVLRDGSIIRSFQKEEYDPSEIRKAMIGRELQGDYYRSDYEKKEFGEAVLRAVDLKLPGSVDGVSFELHRGEILGLGGLAQCGMHEIGKMLFGAVKPASGYAEVLSGKGFKKITSEIVAMHHEVAYLSKDRDTESLNLNASIKDNIAIVGFEQFALGDFLVLYSREDKYVKKQIDALRIKCRTPGQFVSELSGGNKQKVVFGKWVGRNSDILILDCPTRGVDIGVKQAMYQLMAGLANEGKAILLISEELSELLGMADRMLILKDGKVSKEFLRAKELRDADIIDYMI